MKKSMITEAQITSALRQADNGVKVEWSYCKPGISDANFQHIIQTMKLIVHSTAG